MEVVEKIDAFVGKKRAKVGGEFGANGEWYKGGAFIATTDRPKGTPLKKIKKSGKSEYERGKWDAPPETADNIIASALWRQLAGIEIFNKETNTFSFNEELSAEYAKNDRVIWRKKLISAWNKGARWSLVAIEENNKRTVLESFMDHKGKAIKA